MTTLILTFVAAISVFIIFQMGKRYSDHLKEIEDARRENEILADKFRLSIENNSKIVAETHLGFSLVNSLISLHSTREMLENLFRDKKEYQERFRKEAASLDSRIKAREIELRLLAKQGDDVEASLQALAYTFGDVATLEFLATYQKLGSHSDLIKGRISETEGKLKSRIVENAGHIVG